MRKISWRLLLGLLLLFAQTPVALAQPPPGYPRAPHPPGLVPKAPGDIPLQKIKLPPGFQIELWAHGISNPRSLTLGDKVAVFVGTRDAGNVYAVLDQGGTRKVITIAKGLHRPNGVAFKDGSLYVAEVNRIFRFDNIENRLENPPAPVVVRDDYPKDLLHGWKFIRFGPDGMLYVPVGGPCNVCLPSERHALISRIKPDGTGYEVFARGVRNTVGFDWHPDTKELWFTDNGRDLLGDDVPNDELNHAPKAGMHFGFPYCHEGSIPDPSFHANRSCSEFAPPIVKMGPHVAALGMRFYTGSMFPPEYRNRIFIAQRGSWDRPEKIGYRVMQVTVTPGQPPKYEPFAAGWLEGEQFWGRPVDVEVMRDGSLLVSDEVAGAVYRITYKR